jgi:hypothetical protein
MNLFKQYVCKVHTLNPECYHEDDEKIIRKDMTSFVQKAAIKQLKCPTVRRYNAHD